MTSAPQSKRPLRILCIGLEPEEYKVIARLTVDHDATLEIATSEMELTDRARSCAFDLYLLGQTEYMPDTDYLIWLLRDYAEHGRFVLVYSELPPDREHNLEKFHAYSVLHRPISPQELRRTLVDAVTGHHETSHRLVEELEHFWHAVGKLFHKG